MPTGEDILEDERIAWLAFLAHEGKAVSEGQLAKGLGLDRIKVRDLVIRGREIAERVASARVARIRGEIGK